MSDHADRHPITSSDESHERDLNRHRGAEQRDARNEAASRLRERGIPTGDGEPMESLVTVLEAVEAFERAVQARGGDLMVDTPPTREPDNPRFVLPRRRGDESLADLANRIRQATAGMGGARAD